MRNEAVLDIKHRIDGLFVNEDELLEQSQQPTKISNVPGDSRGNIQQELVHHDARDHQSNKKQNNRNDFLPRNAIYQDDVHAASTNHNQRTIQAKQPSERWSIFSKISQTCLLFE